MEQKKHKNQRVQDQVKATLNAFKSDPGLSHDPWFFEKLQNRMRGTRGSFRQYESTWYGRFLRPALLVSLIVFNILAVVWVLDINQTELSSRTAYIDNLADEYGLNIADAYLLSSDVNGSDNGSREH